MRSTLLFLAYLLCCYALAAVLCVPFGDYVTQAAGVPVHKFIGRGGLLLALIGLWPFLKVLKMANKESLGYGLPAAQFRLTLAKGFALGVVILAVLAYALIALGIRVALDSESPLLIKVAAQGLLGGLAVGFIEETFFRGALFSAVRRSGSGAVSAIVFPSLLFAALHFLKPQPVPDGAEVTIATTLTSLGGALPALFRLENLDSFAALFLVGVFLGLVRQRSGHIAWCIGLHAGWVLVIRLLQKYTGVDAAAPLDFLVGHYDGVIGWLAAGWIGVLVLGIWLWPKNRIDKACG